MIQTETKLELAYKILIILSVVDGQYDDREGKVIKKYCLDKESKWYEDFDNVKEKGNAEMLALPQIEIPEAYKGYVHKFRDSSTEEEQLELIIAMYELIMADGRLAVEEDKIFKATAHALHIDVGFLTKPLVI